MANFTYQLLYANVPFVSDAADNAGVRMPGPRTPYGQDKDSRLGIYKQQALPDLIDEINRLLPPDVINDFTLPQFREGNKLDALAYPWVRGPKPDPQLKIGDWYYPTGACRFSVFRGVATSSMAQAMLTATNGSTSATFTMQAVPQGASTPGTYLISTSMFMLPPRPLGELNLGAGFDGLYLITLVDERYWFQYSPVSLQPTPGSSWTSLINQCATALGISVTIPSIPSAYGTRPAGDSQIWTDQENAAFLLDSMAYSIGMMVVRNLNGSYQLQNANSAVSQVNTNRGTSTQVVRQAGGELFTSGTLLPAGDLHASRNAAVPANLQVSFSKYVTGSGPCPHYINPRYAQPQGTSWFEQSHGDSYNISVPASSGGSLVSGLVGTTGYTHTIHSTAKALYPTEFAAFNNNPDNLTDLTSLATQIAQDYYVYQVGAGLDEVYPGTLLWTPEGFHDIIWTYSDKRLGARTRVMRTQWNNLVREMQHGTVWNGNDIVASGAGGHSVAQTWFDQSGNTVYGVNCVTVLGGVVSGQNYSGGVEQLYLTIPVATPNAGLRSGYSTTDPVIISGEWVSGVQNIRFDQNAFAGSGWTKSGNLDIYTNLKVGYIDNSLIVSGTYLLQFNSSDFLLSGYQQSGSVQVYAKPSSGTPWTAGYVDNSLLVSGMKLLRFDQNKFVLSGYQGSGDVDVFLKPLSIGSGYLVSGAIASGAYIILASGLALGTINQDGSEFNFPVDTLVAADTLSFVQNGIVVSGYRFGRILFTDGTTSGSIGVASGRTAATEIDWEGLRIYKGGYKGPEPDIEFIDSASVTWTLGDDQLNERVTVTATATGASLTPQTATTSLTTNQTINPNPVLSGYTTNVLSIALPNVSGKYVLESDVGYIVNFNEQQLGVTARLFNNTAGVRISGSDTGVWSLTNGPQLSGCIFQGTVPICTEFNASGGETIILQMRWGFSGGSPSSVSAPGSATGPTTRLSYWLVH